MEDDEDEFEPLFEYGTREAPPMVEDEDDYEKTVAPKEKQPEVKQQQAPVSEVTKPKNVRRVHDDDDSWLLPPPKVMRTATTTAATNQAFLQQLKSKQQELLQSQKSWQELEEQAPTAYRSEETSAQDTKPVPLNGDTIKRNHQKERILIKVQDKDGNLQSIRLAMDDRFEKLFTAYAASIKVPVSQLVFRFDGDRVAGNENPRSLGLENDDILEVFIKA